MKRLLAGVLLLLCGCGGSLPAEITNDINKTTEGNVRVVGHRSGDGKIYVDCNSPIFGGNLVLTYVNKNGKWVRQ